MGSGRDTDKEPPAQETLPPAYQEKEPLPPDNPDPVVVVDRQEPPVITQQNHTHCKRSKGGRCCCYCCTVLLILILSITVLPIAIVYMTKDLWAQPYVDIRFQGSSRGVTSSSVKQGSKVVVQCHVDMNSRYLPLVQWFHDPNEDKEDGKSGYKLFAVHNNIEDPAYKDRFEVVKTQTGSHRIVYDLMIKDIQPEDAGRYACQVPKTSHRGEKFMDEYQKRSSSSSSSSEDDDDDRSDDHHDDDKRHGCWFRHRRNDYVYVAVTK